jgi:hypothetical protein
MLGKKLIQICKNESFFKVNFLFYFVHVEIDQGKDIVFKFIVEYSSLGDFGP